MRWVPKQKFESKRNAFHHKQDHSSINNMHIASCKYFLLAETDGASGKSACSAIPRQPYFQPGLLL